MRGQNAAAFPESTASASPGTLSLQNDAIVSIDIKKSTEYPILLANLARGDAHHDLSEVFTTTIYNQTPSLKSAFDNGMPKYKIGTSDKHYTSTTYFTE
jgi:hypothetical protein